MDEQEKHAKQWAFLRRTPTFLNWFEAPGILKRIKPYIKPGDHVADLGCGWGYYTFLLADLVGKEGKVYAIDIGNKCIKKISRRSMKRGYPQITAIETSATDLGAIANQSINFIFANGLLCSMEYGRKDAVSEMKRILKPDGFAYISLGSGPTFGLVNENEWNELKTGFTVVNGGEYKNL